MSENIMVIEGEESLRVKLCEVLRMSGYDTVSASDYYDALLRLDSLKPDLVIIDAELSPVGGWDACFQVKMVYDIPVIMIGDDAGVDMWIKALESGADFYFKMPVGYLELPARVKAILRRYRNNSHARVSS